MPDFTSLPSDMRAYAQVGYFLHLWATLDAMLRLLIGHALKLSLPQMAIITANIQFRDKIHILKTVVDISPISPPEKRENFKRTLQEIADYSPIRNMIAHDWFIESADGKYVEFFVIKAKGKLDAPEQKWSTEDFNKAYLKILGWASQLAKLQKALKDADFVEGLLGALRSEPSQEQPSPDSPSPQSPQPQGALDSSPPQANEKKQP